MSILQRIRLLWLRTILTLTSIRFWAVLLVSIASVGQLGLAPIPGMPVSQQQASTAVTDAGGWVENATTPSELNETRIETLVHEEINGRRQNHSLRPLDHDPLLAQIARYHSRDMAQRDYYAHTGPNGETIQDRYQKHDYSCRVPISDTRYATGAENINLVTAHVDVRRPSDGTVVSYDNNREIAEGLVNQWMNSTGHRKNILKPYWQNEGIGVNITTNDEGDTVVYATQNFC